MQAFPLPEVLHVPQVVDTFEDIAIEAGKLCRLGGKHTMTSREIQTAVRLVRTPRSGAGIHGDTGPERNKEIYPLFLNVIMTEQDCNVDVVHIHLVLVFGGCKPVRRISCASGVAWGVG